MKDPDGDGRRKQEVKRFLPAMKADYEQVTGKPFQEFFCPIAWKDEPAELCMGHIVSQKIRNSSRARVVQRKDVDGFFGQTVEPDFTSLVNARSKTPQEVILDSTLRKQLKPRLIVGGMELRYKLFTGQIVPPGHSVIVLQTKDGKEELFLIEKTYEEMLELQTKDWKIGFDGDCRIAALATLIKAAYLTLFRMIGYPFALSPGGIHVGYDILGGFYRANCGKKAKEIRAEMLAYFRPYVHMVRPMHECAPNAPRGTVEDHVTIACASINGKHFGNIIFVRTNTIVHSVLMPSFEDADSVPIYIDFLNNDNETLMGRYCIFDPIERHWRAAKDVMPLTWPKKGNTFQFS